MKNQEPFSFRSTTLVAVVAGLILVPVRIAVAADDAPENLTLADAQRIALQNHPLIKGSEFDVEAAKQAVQIAAAPLYPQIAGSAVQAFAGQNTRIGAIGGLTDPTVIERNAFGLQLSQLITDFGRTESEEQASQEDLRSEQGRRNFTRTEVLLGATQAYYDVLHASALIEVAQDTLKQRQVLLDQITAMQKSQLKSTLDVSIAKQDIDEAQQFMLDADARHKNALATLSQALGYSDYHAFNLTMPGTVPAMTEQLDDLLNLALQGNPQLQTIEAAREAARRRAEAAGKAFNPEISALGYTGAVPWSGPAPSINNDYVAGGIVLNVPLYTGGALTAKADQASAQASSIDQKVEDQRNQLMRDVRIAYEGAKAAYANIDVTKALMQNANTTLDLMQSRYRIGLSSIVDLSQAELRRTQAAITGADATYQYFLKRAALDYLIGRPPAP